MTTYSPPILVLSNHFASTYAAELAATAPDAGIVRHTPEGEWHGDPVKGTVLYMSSDMWRTRMGRSVLDLVADLPALEWVHTSSAGVDHPSFARLLARGVMLTNAAGVNSVAIAQHVLALMLARARRLHQYRVFQTERAWSRLECDELTGATVLIVGLGGIGRQVARLCGALDMRVIGTRRRQEVVRHVDRVMAPDELPEALPEADYVVVACPLTDATRGLIDAAALAAMKPTAYLVNVARGPIVDAAALDAALRAGQIGGAALDVFDQEPLPVDSPLWTAPNLTITPHSAGSSPLNPERNARFFLHNLGRFVEGEPLENVVETVE